MKKARNEWGKISPHTKRHQRTCGGKNEGSMENTIAPP
jgi:hypothetical protein